MSRLSSPRCLVTYWDGVEPRYGHSSQYWPGPAYSNFVDVTDDAATKPVCRQMDNIISYCITVNCDVSMEVWSVWWYLLMWIAGHQSNVDVIVADKHVSSETLTLAKHQLIPVVSSEWVVQCLISGRRLDVTGHVKYMHNAADWLPTHAVRPS